MFVCSQSSGWELVCISHVQRFRSLSTGISGNVLLQGRELLLLSEQNLCTILCVQGHIGFMSFYEYSWVALGASSLGEYWCFILHSKLVLIIFPKTSCCISGPWWPKAVCTFDLPIERSWLIFSQQINNLLIYGLVKIV